MLEVIRRKVLIPGRVVEPPVFLSDVQAEARKGSSLSARTPIECSTPHYAVRLSDTDYLPVLKGEPEGLRHLPDYLVFAQPPAKSRSGAALWVLVCELKSSETGAKDVSTGGKSALRQVQLGRFLVDYLIRLGRFQEGAPHSSRKERDPRGGVVWCAGMIVHPEAPMLLPKARTSGGALPISGNHDSKTDMQISDWRSGDTLRLEDFFG